MRGALEDITVSFFTKEHAMKCWQVKQGIVQRRGEHVCKAEVGTSGRRPGLAR